MPSAVRSSRVVLLELNEITYAIIDPLIERGRLPNFARLMRQGTWCAPDAVERPPNLDPWVTWVTLHTGVDSSKHGSFVLGQDDHTIRAKRSWDYAVEAGKSVGIYGSVTSFPPHPVPGFMVPGPFAPSNATFPPYLEPIQALNRKYTQVHQQHVEDEGVLAAARRAMKLLDLGLSPWTCARAGLQLAEERVNPELRWKRVLLQPLVNYDLFMALYERYRPDYATFHSNHCAHLMHHYWRAWDDSQFLSRAPEEEKRIYGKAIEQGYILADKMIGQLMDRLPPDAILAVASSMGQQPFVKEIYADGKIPVRFKDFKRFLELAGVVGASDMVPTMVPQWNVRVADPVLRERAAERLRAVRAVGATFDRAVHVDENGEILTVTPFGLAKPNDAIRFFFDNAEDGGGGHKISELFHVDLPARKEGYHHPQGVFMLWGDGIPAGMQIQDTTNLDIAPTLLSLLGITIPPVMTGRDLLGLGTRARSEEDLDRALSPDRIGARVS